MARTVPAWERLVREGWFESRDEAVRWIMSGKVRAGSVPVSSAGQRIRSDAPLSVRDLAMRYVGKGGLKLEGALRDFCINVTGKVCMDAGASAGGFTDCLVQAGAARVYAVDVGFGQLAGSLRNHPAVVCLERTNIGDDALLSLDPAPTLGTIDLSYLSLRGAVPRFARILRGRGALICLVKPLFEIDDAQARRTGQVPQAAYAPLLARLAEDFTRDGLGVQGITHSPVTGNHGTLEFFLYLSLEGGQGLSMQACKQAAQTAADAALSLSSYHKGISGEMPAIRHEKEIDHE